MVKNLYLYLLAIDEDIESYGLEVVEIADSCIKNYDADKGKFLHYFNSAWRNKYKSLRGDEAVKEHVKGMHIAEEKIRLIKKLQNYKQKKGEDIVKWDLKKLANIFETSEDELNKVIQIINSQHISAYQSVEGEEVDIFNTLDSGKYVDDQILEKEHLEEIFITIDYVYKECQERQKKILASLLTNEITNIFDRYKALLNILQKFSFYDENIYKEVLLNGEKIELKELAKRFFVKESSLSRTWNNFKDKLNSKYRRK